MADLQLIRFNFSKIKTEEFAITDEKYDAATIVQITFNMGFNFINSEKSIVCHVKARIYQEDRLLVVVGTSCTYKIIPEDWEKMIDEEKKYYVLSRVPAMHLGGLTISTARGILHAKTEDHVINAAILPVVNMQEMIKADIRIEMKN